MFIILWLPNLSKIIEMSQTSIYANKCSTFTTLQQIKVECNKTWYTIHEQYIYVKSYTYITSILHKDLTLSYFELKKNNNYNSLIN